MAKSKRDALRTIAHRDFPGEFVYFDENGAVVDHGTVCAEVLARIWMNHPKGTPAGYLSVVLPEGTPERPSYVVRPRTCRRVPSTPRQL